MKSIFRKITFSIIAVYLTSFWNQGFIIKNDWIVYLKAGLLIAAFYYLIVPVSKLIFLPLNFFTFGLFSTIFYSFVLFFFLNKFSLITIQAWRFPGLSLSNLIISPMEISQLTNIFLSAFSISTIINLLEFFL